MVVARPQTCLQQHAPSAPWKSVSQARPSTTTCHGTTCTRLKKIRKAVRGNTMSWQKCKHMSPERLYCTVTLLPGLQAYRYLAMTYRYVYLCQNVLQIFGKDDAAAWPMQVQYRPSSHSYFLVRRDAVCSTHIFFSLCYHKQTVNP